MSQIGDYDDDDQDLLERMRQYAEQAQYEKAAAAQQQYEKVRQQQEYQQYQQSKYTNPWMTQQGGGIAGGIGQAEQVASPPDFTVCEYVVVGVRRTGDATVMYCNDAKEMQNRVALMQQDTSWREVFIFKKMLGYRAKVEWEAVQVDA